MANDTSFSNPALQIQNAAWIEINLSHLLHNLELIRSTVGPRVSIMAMVKSNAYGHGMVDIAKFLKDRVDMLGVASLKEALELRSAGISSPIFVFGTMFPHEIEECLEKKLAICISSLEQAQAISRRLAGRAEMLRVHIKIDTGMGRMGILAERAKNEILEIAGLQGIVIEGILTHFAVADRPEDPFTEQQISIFKQIVESCEQHGMYFLYKHAANSAAIFSNPSSHFNMVRPGLALYGVSPFPFPLLFPPKADPPLAEKGEGKVRVE
ncbi:MAG: alanine racemase, partial [Candidatus Omnitrophica bacterium]|nr:alanine racemase [Candidatus Omnitrophota bacterium]